MLILTRRPDEAIRIALNIRVVVLGLKGSQVRLGIEAPAEIAVDREEVHLRKHAQLQKAHEDGSPG
jgi:carbon storage regulator